MEYTVENKHFYILCVPFQWTFDRRFSPFFAYFFFGYFFSAASAIAFARFPLLMLEAYFIIMFFPKKLQTNVPGGLCRLHLSFTRIS